MMAFNEDGKVLDDLQDPTRAYPETIAVTETRERLYVHSLQYPKSGVARTLKNRLRSRLVHAMQNDSSERSIAHRLHQHSVRLEKFVMNTSYRSPYHPQHHGNHCAGHQFRMNRQSGGLCRFCAIQ